MHRKPRLRQQRHQFENLETVARNLNLAIDPRLDIGRLVASLEVIKKFLRIFHLHFRSLCASNDRFAGIRAHKLRPVFLQQVRTRKNVGLHNISVDSNHNSDRILVSKLLNHALVVALNRRGDGIHLLLHLFVLHDAGVRGR
jgi:hypothetical protein